MQQPSQQNRPPGDYAVAPQSAIVAAQERHAQRWTPDFDERIYPAHKLAAVVKTLSGVCVPAASSLAGSGLTEDRLRSAATRISYRQTATVFRNALQLSPVPAFALHAGQLMRVTSYGMYGYAAMSSLSHEAALEFAVKYHRVTGAVADVSLVFGDDGALFTYEPILTRDRRDGLYRASVEFVIASHLRLNKDLYGSSFRFDRVRVAYPEPEHAGAYRQLFGCAVDFAHPCNQVMFHSKWLTDPTPYFDPITNAMAREACEAAFANLSRNAGVASHIRRVLIENPGRFPNIEAMAAQLSMNPRKLHRKLEAEGTTYRDLLGEVRMTLAIEYLRKTDMTNEDIASRLGYSDAANFRHAFARWTGRRPSDYRS